MKFWVSFLPDDERTLQRDGIHFCNIRYWADALALADLNGRTKGKVLIKYDPRDLSRIFVRRPSGRPVCRSACYRNLGWPAITLWEQKAAMKASPGQKAGLRSMEAMIFKTTLRQREIEDRAAKQTAAGSAVGVLRRPAQRGDEHDAGTLRGIDSRVARDADEGSETWRDLDIPPHLTSSAAAFLSTPNDGRIRAILSERWGTAPRAAQADSGSQLRLLDHPRTTRMPGVAFYGDSGMGKDNDHGEVPARSSAIQLRSRKRRLRTNTVCSRCRMVSVKPGERRLYERRSWPRLEHRIAPDRPSLTSGASDAAGLHAAPSASGCCYSTKCTTSSRARSASSASC